MCITISKVGIGSDVQAVYKSKLAENYKYEDLPKSKMFYNFFTLHRDNIRFIIGSDKNNAVSMLVYTEAVDTQNISGIYVKYLELFFKNQYIPMPEHIRKQMSNGQDGDVSILNGATNSAGEMVILGTMPDPKEESKTIWMAFVLSPAKMGHRVASRDRYTRTPAGDQCRSMDLWDIIGTAGTVAGIFSLF